MGEASVLKLAAYGVIIAVVLQIIFYFVFQLIGRDSFLLSITLIASVIVGILLLIIWNGLKKAAE